MEFDRSFLEIVGEILRQGQLKPTRTGIDTYSIFNATIETPELGFSGFPVSKLREIYYKGAIIEALWILGIHRNDEKYRQLPFTNTQYLEDNNVTYWKPWQDENGNLGPVYGEQLCRWKKYMKKKVVMEEEDEVSVSYINQIQTIIDTIKKDKFNRRLVCTMWNPGEIDKMALPPCHYAFEFYVRQVTDTGDKLHEPVDRLDMRFIQRSCDMLIGLPYDILIYSIIQKVVALCTGLMPGKIYGCLGDCHVYANQVDQAKSLFNKFRSNEYEEIAEKNEGLTTIKINNALMNKWRSHISEILPTLTDFTPDGSDFTVLDYTSLPKIKIPVAI